MINISYNEYMTFKAYSLNGFDESKQSDLSCNTQSIVSLEDLVKYAKSLDYSLRCIEEQKYLIPHAARKFIELQLSLTKSCDDICKFIVNIHRSCIDLANAPRKKYFDYINNRNVHVLISEIFGFNLVLFNCFGNWPAMFSSKNIDLSNYLSLSDKSKTFGLFDTAFGNWYRPKDF